ncbi:hypothetical protein [Flavobacterium psychrophilum]|uniref:hypothetical protein n=1 Tax=Flavobacterium psychrophilum TaxID=96345 RepID=UPI00106D55B6|nr:hypothetical protein [Flavobacterium psychrophilum]MCB6099431.1 hypothetical protein [Flavobacterium psychrophilum]
MEEHRAKATMVFHRPRSGGSMEKIVPKGDFFHQASALSVVSLGVFHSQEKCLKAEDVGSPERAFRIFGVAEA